MALTVRAKRERAFDPGEFLAAIGKGRKVVPFPRKKALRAGGVATSLLRAIEVSDLELRLDAIEERQRMEERFISAESNTDIVQRGS